MASYNYITVFILQNCIIGLFFFLALLGGGVPSAVNGSFVQNHILEDVFCNHIEDLPSNVPVNTTPLLELCDNLEKLRDAQIASAVSLKVLIQIIIVYIP